MINALNDFSAFAVGISTSVASTMSNFSSSKSDSSSTIKTFSDAVKLAGDAKKAFELSTDKATAAKRKFNLAMAASKVGLLLAGVNLLIQGVSSLVSWFRRQNDAMDDQIIRTEMLSASLEASADAHKSRVKAIEDDTAAARYLLSHIERLSNMEGDSLERRAELAVHTARLNEVMGDLNLSYSMEADILSKTIPEIERMIDARDTLSKTTAAEERMLEVTEERLDVYTRLSGYMEKYNYARKRRLEESHKLVSQWEWDIDKYGNKIKGLVCKYADLKKASEELACELEFLWTQASEFVTNYADISKEEFKRAEKAAKEMARATQEALESIALESLALELTTLKNAATDMFNVLSSESTLSVGEMTANMEKNQQVIAEWADNIEKLVGRGVDQGLLDKLRDAGPQSAGHVAAIVEACYDEINALNTAFQNGGEVALQALATSLGIDISVAQAAADLAREAADTLEDQITAADFPRMGARVGDGLATGIGQSSKDVMTSLYEMSSGMVETFKRTLQIQSPSRVFKELGKQTGDGFIIGIESMSAAIPKVEHWMRQIIEIAARTPAEMQTVGTNIVDGVWHGIQNAQAMFTSNVNDFFRNIVTNAQRSLGINSPSRVFAEIGQNVAKGYIQGLESMASSVAKSTQDVFATKPDLTAYSAYNTAITANNPKQTTKTARPIEIKIENTWYVDSEIDIDEVNRKQAQRLRDTLRGAGFAEIV